MEIQSLRHVWGHIFSSFYIGELFSEYVFVLVRFSKCVWWFQIRKKWLELLSPTKMTRITIFDISDWESIQGFPVWIPHVECYLWHGVH